MHPASPRLVSCDVRVAVLTVRRPAATSAPKRSASGSSDAAATAGPASVVMSCPYASRTSWAVAPGIAPHGASGSGSASIGVRRRPVVTSPAVTSTSTTSPGWTTVEPAGVPVSTTSPGSRVISRDRSAMMSPNPKMSSSPSLASCTRSPFTHVVSCSAAGSIDSAGRYAGPSGVNPSLPLERTFDPRSAYRRS